MARIALLGLVVAVFIFLARALFPSSTRKEGTAETKEMVKDLNCETYVPKTEALHKSIRGKDYFFCGKKCAEEYSRKNA